MYLVRPRILSPVPTRDTLVGGTYIPDNNTTGYLPGTVFSTTSGNLTISTNNGTYQDTKFADSRVTITGYGNFFKNCWFQGNPSLTTSHALVDCDGASMAGSANVFEDCTFAPITPTKYMAYAVVGRNWTSRRCRVYWTIDGFRTRNLSAGGAAVNTTEEQCFVGEHAWYANDVSQTDGSHCDGHQYEGGTNAIMRYNQHWAFDSQQAGVGDQPTGRNPNQTQALSCCIWTNNVDTINGEYYGNYNQGGEIQYNASKDSLSGTDIGSIHDNTFYRNSYYVGHSLDVQSGMTYSQTNNRYDDGTLITVHLG